MALHWAANVLEGSVGEAGSALTPSRGAGQGALVPGLRHLSPSFQQRAAVLRPASPPRPPGLLPPQSLSLGQVLQREGHEETVVMATPGGAN
ncbi:hypothetical protein MC885_021518 [Smutsia gigantea]|nr:hypothetical protein MC885_021518 [Smutsia gigantea]